MLCDVVPYELAVKLKEIEMPIDLDCDTFDSGTEYQREERWCNNTYAEVFDWFAKKGLFCYHSALLGFRQ